MFLVFWRHITRPIMWKLSFRDWCEVEARTAYAVSRRFAMDIFFAPFFISLRVISLAFLMKTYCRHRTALRKWGVMFFVWMAGCFFSPCHKACGILVPWPVTETGPWTWRCWVLTTGPPWNSQIGCKVAFPQVILTLTVPLWHWKHTTSCHHYPDIRLILRQTGWITSRNQDCREK